MNKKACVDCMFFVPDDRHKDRFALCKHPENVDWDPITGKDIPVFCSVQREFSTRCGMNARLFEPRKSEPKVEPVVKNGFFRSLYKRMNASL